MKLPLLLGIFVWALAPAPPCAAAARQPEDLRAKGVDGGVELKWSADEDASGYFVYLSEDGQSFDKVNAKPVRKSSFVVDGLESGREYHFQVTAASRGGAESAPSKAVRASASGAAAPVEAPAAARREPPSAPAAAPPPSASTGTGDAALWVLVVKPVRGSVKVLVDNEELAKIKEGEKEIPGVKPGKRDVRMKLGFATAWKGAVEFSAGEVKTAVVSPAADEDLEVKVVAGPPSGAEAVAAARGMGK